ncbi:hypothetical protein WMF39_12805 [Sorangium sp. So ce1504]|uniref:hypothetical protein n=1 Tax=Sorangium sp. So ce1504 TaxID=3133337 RepID=UPI003F60416F
MRFDLYDRSGGEGRAELAPALIIAGAAPVLGQMGDGTTLALELLVASVAPALGRVESRCAELADSRLDICDGPERAQVDDCCPEFVPRDLDAG